MFPLSPLLQWWSNDSNYSDEEATATTLDLPEVTSNLVTARQKWPGHSGVTWSRDDLHRPPAAGGDGVRAGGALAAAAEDGRHTAAVDLLLLPHIQVSFYYTTM